MGKVALKHTANKKNGTTDYTVRKPKVYNVSRAPHHRSSPKHAGQTLKASNQERVIMKYSPRLQDTDTFEVALKTEL